MAGPGPIILSQDETDYNGAGSNGSFISGFLHAAGNVITLNDGQVTITVNVVAFFGVITDFTITSHPSGRLISTGTEFVQTSTTGAGQGFSLTVGNNNLTTTPHDAGIAADLDVDGSDLNPELNDFIGEPPESAVVWHSGNVPSFGTAGNFGSRNVTNSSIGAGIGSDITASLLRGQIATVAVDATRIQKATVSKTGSGTDPTFGGCVFGSNGTEVSALSIAYIDSLAVLSTANLQAGPYDIDAGESVDASNILSAIDAQATLLDTHRAGAPINLVSCHCSCHSNCHGNRSRR